MHRIKEGIVAGLAFYAKEHNLASNIFEVTDDGCDHQLLLAKYSVYGDVEIADVRQFDGCIRASIPVDCYRRSTDLVISIKDDDCMAHVVLKVIPELVTTNADPTQTSSVGTPFGGGERGSAKSNKKHSCCYKMCYCCCTCTILTAVTTTIGAIILQLAIHSKAM
jgi:hypothetical protein